MNKFIITGFFFILSACERDLNIQTADITINNTTNLRVAPLKPLSIWSIYITPTGSTVIDRSVDLLNSVALEAGLSKTFTIDTCGSQIDVLVILSDGSEQAFTSAAAVDCNTTDYFEDVI